MRIPPEGVAWLGAEALRRIQAAPLTDQQRFLLGECVQAYLPLDEAQKRAFEGLVATERYQGVQAMNTTWYEKGVDQGRRNLLRAQLEERFGLLSSVPVKRLQMPSGEALVTLGKALVRAQSLRDLGLED